MFTGQLTSDSGKQILKILLPGDNDGEVRNSSQRHMFSNRVCVSHISLKPQIPKHMDVYTYMYMYSVYVCSLELSFEAKAG